VTTKLDPIEKEMRRLLRKPKPKPPKLKANGTNGTKANGTASAANDTATAAEDAPGTPEVTPEAADADAAAEPAADDEKPAEELPAKDEV